MNRRNGREHCGWLESCGCGTTVDGGSPMVGGLDRGSPMVGGMDRGSPMVGGMDGGRALSPR